LIFFGISINIGISIGVGVGIVENKTLLNIKKNVISGGAIFVLYQYAIKGI